RMDLRGSNHNVIYNNSFSGSNKAIVFGTPVNTPILSFNNTFYHNSFASISNYYFEYYSNSEFPNYFNTTVNNMIQGNQYDDYCDQGTDLNSDGYADNSTTATSADWPYNQTVSTKIFAEGANFIDSGPRIITCPAAVVNLGSSSSSSGGSSRPAAAASAPSAPTSAETGGTRETPPPPPPSEETYSASETAEFLERQVSTQDFTEKSIKVTVILENTGTKKMFLFPEIFQKIGDPFFIVTRKTLGFEGSFFTKLTALSYSRDPVAGRLLKATIINPEQIILNPGEKIEKVIEIDEGLPIPREIKIQFTTLGETVFEEDVIVKQKGFSGTALDIDKEHQYLDIYAVIVPGELTKQLEEYYAGSPTGAAITIPQKKNFVGFAQQIMQKITPETNQNQYQLELGLYEPGSSEAFFTDLYGPYQLKENQTFIFAQQLKYNPQIYSGNYQLRTKIYRSSSLLVQNQFDVNLGEEKRGMLWPWIAVQSALVLMGAMIYLMVRSSRKKLHRQYKDTPENKKDL
ncbi:MAG: hypothetical protein Q7K45_07110, partial [Nanoarchaeota archaeon]|nr:hypothetical protein [Nanoarchaeota archaeon]